MQGSFDMFRILLDECGESHEIRIDPATGPLAVMSEMASQHAKCSLKVSLALTMQHIQDCFAPSDSAGVIYLSNIEKLAGALTHNNYAIWSL